MGNITRLVPFWLAVLLAAGGCGSSLADLCDAYCDCEGCSDRDYDDCVHDAERAEDDADDEGCGGELGDYAGCLLDNSDCRHGDFDIDYNDCDNERHDLYDCVR